MANLTVQVIGQKSYSRNEVSDWRIYGALQRWPKDSREIQVKYAGKDVTRALAAELPYWMLL